MGCQCEDCMRHGAHQYMAMGFGSMYNHADTPNTIQLQNFEDETMLVKARQNILPGEEIFVNYGNRYFLVRNFWKNIRQNNEFEKKLLEMNKAKEAMPKS
jgi:SET domain-containing protein